MTTNLPYHLTTFIGREEDLAGVRLLLGTRRLVTLTGPGGIGKTRLALQVAAELDEAFPDGIWLVEIAFLTDPSLISQLLLGTCNIRELGDRTPWELLIETWSSKRLLLILDNCEHMLDACATLASALLSHCPYISLLITSREALQITGETVWTLAGLSVPSGEELPSLDRLISYDAVRFFVDRARTVKPRFALTEQNAQAVVQICAHLDGIPLALELAVARLPMFSVEQIVGRLDERFRLFTGGSRTADSRQQTLQATVDWSYALLSPIEQLVFCRLSVFAGSWTLEAVEGICSDAATAAYDLLDVLTHLVNKSLVVAESVDDVVRYRLLETIQHYAWMRQKEQDENEQFTGRHWHWYRDLAEEAAKYMRGGEQQQWFVCLENESENLRLAMERSLAAGQIEIMARIACALGHFWATRSRLTEGRTWYEVCLSHPELEAGTRIRVLQQMTEILRFQGEYVRIGELLQELLMLLQNGQDTASMAETLCSLGWTAFYEGRCEESIHYCTEGLHLFQQLENQRGIAICLSGLALVATIQQSYSRALEFLREVLTIRRQQQDQAELAYALNGQSRAAALYGEDALACQAGREALDITARLRQPFGTTYNLEAVATIAFMRNNAVAATQLFSAAQAFRSRIGVPLPPSLRAVRERELQPLRVQLGKVEYGVQWMRGQSFSLDEARAVALQVLTESPPPGVSGSGYPAGLTQREVDVLCLVAAGYTDIQVAKELVLSPRTVNTHLSSVYRKIGVNSRTAATRWAQEHHLL